MSDYGDLGVDKNQWLRVQLVTYGNGYWIVRFQNPATGVKVDVAEIHNPYTTLTKAEIVQEEGWLGTQNPWAKASFYNMDFKYRSGSYWSHMPSNVNNYGSTSIWAISTSGADIVILNQL